MANKAYKPEECNELVKFVMALDKEAKDTLATAYQIGEDDHDATQRLRLEDLRERLWAVGRTVGLALNATQKLKDLDAARRAEKRRAS